MMLLGAAGLCPASAPALDCYREIDPYYLGFNIPSMIHIATSSDAVRVRSNMTDLLWNEAPWPTGLPEGAKPVYGAGSFEYDCVNPVDPLAIPGLALWLDSSDPATFTLDGARVVGWRDKIKKGQDASQSAPTSQPLLVADPINGQPALFFDGVDDFLQMSPTLDLTQMTVFMVIRVLDPAGVPNSAPLATNPVDGGYMFLIGDDNKPAFRVRVGSNLYDARDTTPVGTAPDIWAGSFDEMRVRLFRNGSEAGSFTARGPLPTNPGGLRIGDGAQNAFRGYIAEIIAYDSALPAAEFQRINEYLSCKYQIPFQPPSWLLGLGGHNLSRALRLEIPMDYGMRSYAYLLLPAVSVNRLMIFHQGHNDNVLESGGQETMEYFLDRGFSILAFWMPLHGENPSTAYDVPGHGTVQLDGHYQMYSYLENDRGSYLRFFIEPVIAAINFIQKEYSFLDINMVGISGGGWTTTLCAALDPRIRLSFPVAGTLPLYLTSGPCPNGSEGDWEQRWPPQLFEDPASSYLDLYILGGYGRGRRQIQILNQFDSCCYGGINYRTYEPHVVDAVTDLGWGSYSVYLDSSHQEHKISSVALSQVIYPALLSPIETSVAPSSDEPAFAMRTSPNPFRATNSVSYNLPNVSTGSASRILLAVYDVSGRRVATLVDGPQTPGIHQETWNGRDDRGLALPAGVYWYSLRIDEKVLNQRVILLR